MEAPDRGFRAVLLGTEEEISCSRLHWKHAINSPSHAPGSKDGAAVLGWPHRLGCLPVDKVSTWHDTLY